MGQNEIPNTVSSIVELQKNPKSHIILSLKNLYKDMERSLNSLSEQRFPSLLF